MKIFKSVFLLSIVLILFACEEDKRFPIKIIETKKGYYEWYYYSLITSDGPDYVDFVDENCERTVLYKGHDVIDVRLENSKVVVECFECDTIEFNPMYKNQIQIIENNNPIDLADASLIRDSLKRNVKSKKCN
jgi:hypothetical protein